MLYVIYDLVNSTGQRSELVPRVIIFNVKFIFQKIVTESKYS